MIGSTLIAEKDPSRLASITSAEDLEDFARVDLEAMTTIDFESVTTSGGVPWAVQGDPVHYDEAGGMVVFKVSEAGLSYLLNHATDVPEEHEDDMRALAEFIQEHGTADIYEFATF